MNPIGTVNPGPIIPASDRGNIYDNAQPVPNVSRALTGWFKPMTVGIVTKQIVNGSAVEKIVEVETAGMLQPGDKERLSKLAEGNRSWKNWLLHVNPGLDINTNGQIEIKGVRYTVMTSTEYADFGFDEFELLEGYRNAAGF